MADRTLGERIDAVDTQAVDAWLTKHQVADDDADYIKHRGVERLLTYRRLVRANLREAIEVTMPRVTARLGPLFEEYFDRFATEQGPRTHYLRDVCSEFLAFVAPLWALDRRVAPYLLELADHEVLQIELASMQAGVVRDGSEELSLEKGIQFIEACRIVYYEHALHELSDDEEDRTLPRATPTHLFAYRSPEHEVRYLKLTDLAAQILIRLLALKEPLGAAIRIACEDRRLPLSEAVLSGTAELLADLAERGALVGAR
jgi:hypothetical protein